MKTATKLCSLAALLACLAAPAARAQTVLTQTVFTLTPADQTGSAGSTLHFTGLLTNTGTTSVFLNGEFPTFNAPPQGLSFDTTPFDSGAPTSLAPGTSYSGGFFDVSITAPVAPGTYLGNLTITGGADGSASDTVASSPFSVTVQSPAAAPEPAPLAGLGLAALGVGGLLLRARRRRPRTSGPQAL